MQKPVMPPNRVIREGHVDGDEALTFSQVLIAMGIMGIAVGCFALFAWFVR